MRSVLSPTALMTTGQGRSQNSNNRWSGPNGSDAGQIFDQELIDSIVAAVDTDRGEAIDRLRTALDTIGLDEAFNDELRLSGVGSLTWNCCQFCSEMVAHEDAA